MDFMDFPAHTYAVADVLTGSFIAAASTQTGVIAILHDDEISDDPFALALLRVVAYDAAGHKINEWAACDVFALGQPA